MKQSIILTGARPDPAALSPGREFPRLMYHAAQAARTVSGAQEEADLGPDWSRTYIEQAYPSVRYHWNGKTITVKNSGEDTALGGGWARTPAAFDAYKGGRPIRTEKQDPVRWLDEWSVPGLSSGQRKKIKAQLLRADGAFERSVDPDSAALACMQQAFHGIAEVLFDAGILTGDLLRKDIPQLVWDSAIGAGWWRLASETHQDIFPEQLGHYWVWRDDSRDWKRLFRAEAGEWEAMLLEAPSPEMSEAPASEPTGDREPSASSQLAENASAKHNRLGTGTNASSDAAYVRCPDDHDQTIGGALDRRDRKGAAALWVVDRQKKGLRALKKAIYEEAGQDKAEYYKWERGEKPDGSRADRDIRAVLLKPLR